MLKIHSFVSFPSAIQAISLKLLIVVAMASGLCVSANAAASSAGAGGTASAGGAATDLLAQVKVSKETEWQVKGGDVQLLFVGSPQLSQAKIMLSGPAAKEWKIFESSNKILLQGPGAGKAKITIEAPSASLVLGAKSGWVQLQNWRSHVKGNFNQIKFSSLNGSGSLALSAQRGEVLITGHEGPIRLDLFNVTTQLKDITGDINWTQHSGFANLEKHTGHCQFNSYSAQFKSVQAQGSLSLDVAKGNVSLFQYQGRVDAQLAESSANIQALEDSELSLKSTSGKMSLQTPQQSGAFLNLSTEDGDLVVPSELAVRKTATEKQVKGRLRGSAQKLSVYARSQSGSIIVK